MLCWGRIWIIVTTCLLFGSLGIVSRNWKHGKYDPNFDLVPLIDDSHIAGKALTDSIDIERGRSFQKCAFRWHADQILFGTLLQLGKHYQSVLSEYTEEDERLSHLRWIQNVKTGHFSKAATGLMSLSSEGLVAFKDKSGN